MLSYFVSGKEILFYVRYMTESFLLDLFEKGENLINDPIFFKDIQHFRCRLFDLGVDNPVKFKIGKKKPLKFKISIKQ